jgi:hypothetical protein
MQYLISSSFVLNCSANKGQLLRAWNKFQKKADLQPFIEPMHVL